MGLEGAGISSNDIVVVSIDILLAEVILDVKIGGGCPEFLIFLPHW